MTNTHGLSMLNVYKFKNKEKSYLINEEELYLIIGFNTHNDEFYNAKNNNCDTVRCLVFDSSGIFAAPVELILPIQYEKIADFLNFPSNQKSFLKLENIGS